MTWDWKVDESGNVEFDENGNIALVHGDDRLAQSIRLGLMCWKGSKLDDPNFGVDWYRVFRNPDNLPIEELIEMEINAFMSSGFEPEIYQFTYITVERTVDREFTFYGRIVKQDGTFTQVEQTVRLK
jgi:hypothetical protein